MINGTFNNNHLQFKRVTCPSHSLLTSVTNSSEHPHILGKL